MQCWMLTGLTAVITLQYIQISNYYVLHLELIYRHTSFYCTLLYLADNCIFYKWSFVATLHSDSSVGKESACNAGDPSSISGLERSPGEGKGYPLQYSGLENSMDCIVGWGCKESNTTDRLSLCIRQVYQHHFPNSICSLHVSVQHFGNSHSISSFFWLLLYLLWWSVISDLWCSYCNCFGVPQITTI